MVSKSLLFRPRMCETIDKSDGILTLPTDDALLMLLLTEWTAKKTMKIATCILRFIFPERMFALCGRVRGKFFFQQPDIR